MYSIAHRTLFRSSIKLIYSRVSLPEYVLDFGHVILGTLITLLMYSIAHRTLFRSSIKLIYSRVSLPEYVLDFGHVILGTVQTHLVHATNTGCLPVSFQVEHKSVQKLGFDVHMDKVRNLPGRPNPETVDIVIRFDPARANLPMGVVQKLLMINVCDPINLLFFNYFYFFLFFLFFLNVFKKIKSRLFVHLKKKKKKVTKKRSQKKRKNKRFKQHQNLHHS